MKNNIQVNDFILSKIKSVFDLLKNEYKRNFIESVDVSINLNINTKDINQYIYGYVLLPYGSGKVYKIAVFDNINSKELIYSWGAYLVGMEDLVNNILKNKKCNFNLVIATLDSIKLVNKISHILGPKKLMPNIKFGTVTSNLKKTIKNFLKGQIIYKNDKFGIINASIGRINFSSRKLSINLLTLIESIKSNKPKFVKNINFINKIYISSTMSNSYIVNL